MTNNVKIQTADLSVIDKIVVIVPEFTQWTGTRAMHEGDFRIGTNGQLPPKEVAKSLGLKAIINIEKLRIFDRIKHRSEALLEGCGVKYLSGWAIPEARSAEVFKKLDDIVADYEKAKSAFLSDYDTHVADWARENPAFSKEILDGKLDREDVASRISAGYEAFRLQPANDAKAEQLADRVTGLGGELIASVSQFARTFFRDSFLGKDRANRKTVNAVVRIRERLSGLAFLNGTITPLVEMIDGVLKKMPSEGYFGGEAFWQLATLVKTLGDDELLAQILRGQVTVAGLTEAIGHEESPVPQQQELIALDAAAEEKLAPNEVEKVSPMPPELLANIDAFFKSGNGASAQTPKAEETTSPAEGEGAFLPPKSDEEIAIQPEAVTSADIAKKDEEIVVPIADGHLSDGSAAAIPVLPEVDVGEGLYF